MSDIGRFESLRNRFESEREDRREELAYLFSNETFQSGYWKELAEFFGFEQEYEAFYEAYEVMVEILSDYMC